MGRRHALLACLGVLVVVPFVAYKIGNRSNPAKFSSTVYVTFHTGLFKAPGVQEEISGLPEGISCEVVSEDHGDAAKGFQILLRDGNSMNQVLRPSDESETILLIGRRGYLRVKALEWFGHNSQANTVEAVKLQFDYKLPPDVTTAP